MRANITKLILFTLMLSPLTFAKANMSVLANFENGNNIAIARMTGRVTFSCRDPIENHYSKTHFCDGLLFSPGSHDYFVTNVPMDADEVIIIATHEDGSTREKQVPFDSKKSRSKLRINLTMSSFFQRPLLELGDNLISYELRKNDQIVATGSFVSKLRITENRECRSRMEFTQNENYCKNKTMGCDHYFYLENNCIYQ